MKLIDRDPILKNRSESSFRRSSPLVFPVIFVSNLFHKLIPHQIFESLLFKLGSDTLSPFSSQYTSSEELLTEGVASHATGLPFHASPFLEVEGKINYLANEFSEKGFRYGRF